MTEKRVAGIMPRLPKDWDKMALRKIKAFGQDFDIDVVRDSGTVQIKVTNNKTNKVQVKSITAQNTPISFEL